MRNYAKLGCGIVLALAVALPCRSSYGLLDGSYMSKVTTEAATPHLSWAKPLAGGPVKVLFIVPGTAARDVVELAQRMDLDFKAVTIAHSGIFAFTDYENAALSGTSLEEKERELVDALGGRYDLIVLANLNMAILPLEAQYRIIRYAADGGGVLFTYGTSSYAKVLAHPLAEGSSQIADGIGWQGLPTALRATEAKNVVRTYGFGKGRIAVLAYPGGFGTWLISAGLTEGENWSESWWSSYETNMALVMRAVLWAAGRAPRAAVSFDPKTTARDADDILAKGVALQVQSKELKQATVSLRWRMDDNAVLEEQEQPVNLDTGSAGLTFKPKQCPVGAMHLDAIVRSDKGVETVGTWTLTVQGALAGASLATDREAYEADQPVRVTVKGIAAGRPLTLRVRLADMPYRQVWQQREVALAAGQAEWTGEFAASPDWPTPAGFVQCELWDGPQFQARLMKYLYFPRHRRPLYTAYAWDGVPACLAPMYAQQVVEGLGWHVALGGDPRTMALFNQRTIPYMTRIVFEADDKGHTLHGPWGMTEQEAASIKEDQSFYNPKVQALWKKWIDQRIVNVPLYDPLVYSLGDENGFSYEAGYSPSDETAFRDFLRKRYGQIENLNREWQTTFADFDSVKHYTLREMMNDKRYAAWFDHRCFMEQEYADTHHFLADCIRSKDPHAGVGAEGSQQGNLEESIRGLQFWGPYTEPLMNELLGSIGADRLRSCWWGGYPCSHGGHDRYPMFLWRPLLQGAVNADAWFNSGVNVGGLLGADFSYPDYVALLAPPQISLNRGIGTLLVDQPMKSDGIVILWSHASATAGIMASEFYSPNDGAAAFTEFCQRQGLQFDFVTSSMIERGALKPYKFLFLPGATALSEAEARRIVEFAEQGGVVLADLDPGILSGYCRPLDHSSLADFFDFPDLKPGAPLVFGPLKAERTVRGKNIAFRAQKTWQLKPAQDGVSPVLRSHVVGKGLAVLLNFAMGSAVNTADPATTMDDLLLNLLALVEIRPMVAIQGADTESLVLRLRQKGDGVTLGLLANRADVGKTVTLTLPEAMFVYRADGGFLAQEKQISLKLDVPFQVLCLFPKEQSAPRLATDAGAAVQAGQVLAFDAGGLNRDTVYRIEVLDPKGLAISPRTQILAGSSFAARAALSVPFAWNDAAGKYTVVLTDVRTGLQGRQEVEVRAAAGAAVFPTPVPMYIPEPVSSAPAHASLPDGASQYTASLKPRVTEMLSDEKSRGDDIKRDRIALTLATATIKYCGLFHPATGELAKGQYGDLSIGLDFCGHWGETSTWNWSCESFMSAEIQGAKGKLPMMGYRPSETAVLEEQPRVMAQMRWPVDKAGKAFDATLTALQLPDEPTWIFLRLDLDASAPWWSAVNFCSYPYVSAGPKERERWYATMSKTAAVTDSPAAIPPDNCAIAFFNKVAQQKAATFLVYNPEQFKSVTVAGTYGIGTCFLPRPGQRSLTFALGCRMDEPGEANVREFQRETAQRISGLLQHADWTPHISFDASDRFAKEMTEWLRIDGAPDAQARWSAIVERYEAARQAASPAAVLACREETAAFKQDWLQQALKRYL